MSRIALNSVVRAQREVLTLELALYHAARDYPGGAAAIAATTGRNASTLQHKLSPTHPSHMINVQEFGEILELTKDRRILDAVHALVGDTIWQELAEAYTCDMPETLTVGIATYFRQVADLADTWAKSIGDPRMPAANERLTCVIESLDGTWHRPFTTFEMAALQSLVEPEEWLELDGLSDQAWRERIGNAVPPAAAEAIALTMGTTLLLAGIGETFMLSNLPVWVR